MKSRKAIIAIVLAVGVLAAVPFAYGGPGGRGHGGPRMHGGAGFGAGMFFGHLGHLKDELELSDAQVDQLKAIFEEVREQNAQYREQLRGGVHGAAEALLSNPNDLAGAQAILDQQTAAEKAMKQNMLIAASKALNVLTAGQRSELSQIVKERSERRGQRRQNRQR
jgi:Spy/CpxP family protein refolding chaperone